MLSLSVQLRRAAHVAFRDGWQSETLAAEAANTIDRMASAITDDNKEIRRLNDEIDRLTRELAEARDKALEEVARYHENAVMQIRYEPSSYKNGKMRPSSKRASDIHERSAIVIRCMKEKP